MNLPLFSVVLPVSQRSGVYTETRSVLAQTYVSLEILIG
jgi:hypothetical protein